MGILILGLYKHSVSILTYSKWKYHVHGCLEYGWRNSKMFFGEKSSENLLKEIRHWNHTN